MTLKLYTCMHSPACRALVLFLNSTEIEYKRVEVKNPGERKLPVMDDNGYILTEPVAIFKYICGTQNVQGHWYSKDTRASIDEYLAWQNAGLRVICQQISLALAQISTEITSVKKSSSTLLQEYRELFKEQLDVIESHFLKDQDFLTGETISIADLWAACVLSQTIAIMPNIEESHPTMTAWFDRVRNNVKEFNTINGVAES